MLSYKSDLRQAFFDLARRIYGEQWQGAAARALHVSDRTVRRVVAGSSPLPSGWVDDLRSIAAIHLTEMTAAIEALDTYADLVAAETAAVDVDAADAAAVHREAVMIKLIDDIADGAA